MISNIRLKFGRIPGAAGEQITATPVTVFVGPNNSGKSKVLTEIEQFCRNGNKDANALILDDLTFEGLTGEKVMQAIDHLKQPPNQGEALPVDHLFRFI
jgi:ABC-type enterochelin transport system ATPase subunit